MRKRLSFALAVASVLAISGCDIGVLDPKGPIGVQERQIMIDSVAIMLAIIIPTIVAIVACAWWFRATNTKARFRPHLVYSGRIELVVWAIPALTVFLLAGVIWESSHLLDPAEPVEGVGEPIDIQVVSLDWKWLFIYPKQKLASVNELVVPVGAPLRLSLTSGSVMTVFFVPQWGSMIYTMNRMTTRLNLRADVAGDYRGLAAHISGDGFSDMHFVARAVTPDAFADWAKGAKGADFDAAAYKDLSKQGTAAASLQPLADPTLFDDVVSQKLPPGPGPEPTPHPSGSRS
jgi:cytochrome o ubiquinol oxidase subunit II